MILSESIVCELEITLPWPPSVNKYWRCSRGQFHIGTPGKNFRAAVESHLVVLALTEAKVWDKLPLCGPIALAIEAFPPDRRRRDVDNLFKALLDALQHGGLYEDDNQIADLSISRREVVAGGKVVVRVRRMVS